MELKAVLLDHHPRPYAAEDFVLGNQLPARFNQYHEDIEGSAAKRNRHPLGKKFAAVR